MRRSIGVAIAVMALSGLSELSELTSPARAEAAQRFVTPDGSGSECTEVVPCAIETGVNAAEAGDEVIVAPGIYATSTPLASDANDVRVHGARRTSPPHIFTTADTGFSLSGFSAHAGDLAIVHTGGGIGADLSSNGSGFQRISVRSATGEAACAAGPATTLRDSLCVADADSAAAVRIEFTGPGGPSQIRNLTAIAHGTGSIGLVVGSGTNTTNIVSVENTILRGGLVDARAFNAGTGSMTIVGINHSNFDSADSSGTNSAVSVPGSAANQTVAPVFTGGAAYRQAVDSPTVDAGITDAYTGRFDLDGHRRPLGAAMDIGSDELIPDADPPETKITGHPFRRTRSKVARFAFTSSEVRSTFRCTLDGTRIEPCRSPLRLLRLGVGRHRFAVAAIDRSGNVDPTPAIHRWRIRPAR